jgi:hypothetical protein
MHLPSPPPPPTSPSRIARTPAVPAAQRRIGRRRRNPPSPSAPDAEQPDAVARILRTEAAVSGVSRKAAVAQQQSTRLWPRAVLEALDSAVSSCRWESALEVPSLGLLPLPPVDVRHLNINDAYRLLLAIDLRAAAEAALVQAEVADLRETADDARQVSPARSGHRPLQDDAVGAAQADGGRVHGARRSVRLQRLTGGGAGHR